MGPRAQAGLAVDHTGEVVGDAVEGKLDWLVGLFCKDTRQDDEVGL